MTAFEKLQIAMLFLAGLGGLVSPVIGVMLARHYKRLDHIDDCLDHLKMIVVGTTATRGDLDARLLTLRSDIAKDTTGLHDRLFRLEGLALGPQP
jgi:hypothetical protein